MNSEEIAKLRQIEFDKDDKGLPNNLSKYAAMYWIALAAENKIKEETRILNRAREIQVNQSRPEYEI